MSLLVKIKLMEWGPIRRDTFVLRLTPLMPPGYAWHRWVKDNPRERQRRREAEVNGDEYELPVPQREEDIRKAQQALVKWNLRQFRKRGMLVERDDDTLNLTQVEIDKLVSAAS